MRVVLDSNVLFAALISPYSPPHKIYQAWLKGRFELITCREQIEEIRRASRYPKLQRILQGHRVGTLINRLYRGNLVDKLPRDMHADDPNDAFLLAMSIAGRAEFLVTGDKRSGLLQRGSYGQTRIITPDVFCREILKISD